MGIIVSKEEGPLVRCHPAVPLATGLAAVLGLAGCSDGADAGARVAEGDPAACPGDVVAVVVSVGQWGGVVEALGGDCATVTTIVASSAVDPHDFEPTTADIAAFSDADLVVLNGSGYDNWARTAAVNVAEPPVLISADEVVGVADGEEHEDGEHEGEHAAHGGADPHLWYEPDAVAALSAAVSDELSATSPETAAYFAERRTAWNAELDEYRAAVEEVRAVADGRTYAATESVFDRMAAAVGLTDATPEGYRRAASNESEPAPGDLTEFEQALADGSIDVLVYNVQTSGSIPEVLRTAAEDADVPVLEVTESPPDASGSFLEWQLDQLAALSEALGGTP
jgi:zinc/manganese transport system substrate-binding protein